MWPEADFLRTHTLKVKKAVLVGALSAGLLNSTAAAGARAGGRQRRSASASGVGGQRRGAGAGAGETHEHTLGGDLDLESLSRVEMLSIIKQEMGVYIDESLVGFPDDICGAAGAA